MVISQSIILVLYLEYMASWSWSRRDKGGKLPVGLGLGKTQLTTTTAGAEGASTTFGDREMRTAHSPLFAAILFILP